jgi:hypothetical protein
MVVCDGRKALILENIGDAVHPNLHTREVREHPEPRTSEQGTDRPGKTHQSVGTARAVEQTDRHDHSDRDVAVTKCETDHLAVGDNGHPLDTKAGTDSA